VELAKNQSCFEKMETRKFWWRDRYDIGGLEKNEAGKFVANVIQKL